MLDHPLFDLLLTFVASTLSVVLQIWDLSSHLTALAESETEGIQGASTVFNQAPLVSFGGHKVEGYAVDWCPLVQGRLVTGNIECNQFIWTSHVLFKQTNFCFGN